MTTCCCSSRAPSERWQLNMQIKDNGNMSMLEALRDLADIMLVGLQYIRRQTSAKPRNAIFLCMLRAPNFDEPRGGFAGVSRHSCQAVQKGPASNNSWLLLRTGFAHCALIPGTLQSHVQPMNYLPGSVFLQCPNLQSRARLREATAALLPSQPWVMRTGCAV